MKKSLLRLSLFLIGVLIIASFAIAITTMSKAQISPGVNGGTSDLAGIYLTIAGIPGEVNVPGHLGSINITSYNWNESNTGKVVSGPFNFVKPYDESSPLLVLYCATGKVITSMDLQVIKSTASGGELFVEYKFTTAYITYYGTSGDTDRLPGVLDQFSVDFRSLTVTYFLYNGTSVSTIQTTLNG